MLETKSPYDETRLYAVECPACHRWIRLAGATLNKDKTIKCPMCKAISKKEKWAGDVHM